MTPRIPLNAIIEVKSKNSFYIYYLGMEIYTISGESLEIFKCSIGSNSERKKHCVKDWVRLHGSCPLFYKRNQ